MHHHITAKELGNHIFCFVFLKKEMKQERRESSSTDSFQLSSFGLMTTNAGNLKQIKDQVGQENMYDVGLYKMVVVFFI